MNLKEISDQSRQVNNGQKSVVVQFDFNTASM
jgi:hypothetical protein